MLNMAEEFLACNVLFHTVSSMFNLDPDAHGQWWCYPFSCNSKTSFQCFVPSVPWCCWLRIRKDIQHVKSPVPAIPRFSYGSACSLQCSGSVSLLTHKGIRPVRSWVLACWWWWFDRNFARLIAPVVTTTSFILSSSEIQKGHPGIG